MRDWIGRRMRSLGLHGLSGWWDAGTDLRRQRLDRSDGQEYRYAALAQYNAERSRGLAHTPEWDALMAEDQAKFNAEMVAAAVSTGDSGHGPEEEFGPWCVVAGQEHDWSAWDIGPVFPREERFCSKCGGMETQEFSADE
jgi:hypothetical protein